MFQHFPHILRAILDNMEGVDKKLIVVSTHHIHHSVCAHLWKLDRFCYCSANCHHDRCGYVSIIILPQYPAQCSLISQYRHGKDTRLFSSFFFFCCKHQEPVKRCSINFHTHFRVLELLWSSVVTL